MNYWKIGILNLFIIYIMDLQREILLKIENLYIKTEKYKFLRFTFSNSQNSHIVDYKNMTLHQIELDVKKFIQDKKTEALKYSSSIEKVKIIVQLYKNKIDELKKQIKITYDDTIKANKQINIEQTQQNVDNKVDEIILFFYSTILYHLIGLILIKEDIVLENYDYLLTWLDLIQIYVETDNFHDVEIKTISTKGEQEQKSYNSFLIKIDNIFLQVSTKVNQMKDIDNIISQESNLQQQPQPRPQPQSQLQSQQHTSTKIKYIIPFLIIIPLLLLVLLKHINFFDNFSGGKNTYINEKNDYKKLKKYYYN